MPNREDRIGVGSLPNGPRHPTARPLELARFRCGRDPTALFHAAGIGPLVVKAPAHEWLTLHGPVPIGLVHELSAHPRSPVVRSLLTFVDRPEAPLRLGTFANPGDPDRHAHVAALAEQDELPLLCDDGALRHRLSKHLRNATAARIPRPGSARLRPGQSRDHGGDGAMRKPPSSRPGQPSRATVGVKGQLTIPRAIQRHLGWQAGDWLLGEVLGDDRFALRRISPPLGKAIRERQRGRRTLAAAEVLLLALLADPATAEDAVAEQIARMRHGRNKEVSRR